MRLRRRGRVLAALAAASPVLATASPGPAAPPRALLLEGDSLALGTSAFLSARLPRWRIRTDAAVGLDAAEVHARLRAAPRLPPVLALSAGTNDDPRRVRAFRRTVRGVLALAGTRRCVVWPTLVAPPVAGQDHERLNRVLERRSGPGLEVVDWVGMLARHPEWLGPDGVHPTTAGYRARARAVGAAVRRCGERLGT